MAFTQKDVDYIAKLARLYLSDQEKENFTGQLDSILSYIDKLNELDTANVEPTAHILPLKNVFREDKAIPCQTAHYAISQSPSLTDNLYSVPRVIE
jgi:aspartyl-tRNA(Asn)/glutamyl-tRNA(Gln) amidotransferase subunit C